VSGIDHVEDTDAAGKIRQVENKSLRLVLGEGPGSRSPSRSGVGFDPRTPRPCRGHTNLVPTQCQRVVERAGVVQGLHPNGQLRPANVRWETCERVANVIIRCQVIERLKRNRSTIGTSQRRAGGSGIVGWSEIIHVPNKAAGRCGCTSWRRCRCAVPDTDVVQMPVSRILAELEFQGGAGAAGRETTAKLGVWERWGIHELYDGAPTKES
jgi:hypothetical protein